MKSARKLAAVATIAASALLVSACSGGAPAAAPTSAAAGSVELRMSVWTSDENQLALFNSVADEYKTSHPEIKSITFESLPFADYNTTLTTQVAGGNAPDLAWVGDIAKDLIVSDAMVPLTEPFKATKGYDYDDILPSVATSFSQDGELYAYPFSNSPFALYVNKTLLAEAGQTVDPANLTWENVSKMGAAVNAQTGKAGFVIRDFNFSSWLTLPSVWTGWGAEAWNAKGDKCGMDSPEMVDAFQFLHDAVYVDKSMPGPGVTADFFAGDSAFTTAQVSRASLLDGSFEFDIYPLPAGPAGDYSVLGQAGMGVLQSSKHPQEAVEFLSFLTNPTNSAKLAQFFPPPRESLLTGEKLAAVNTKLSAEQLQRVVVDELPEAVSPPVHTGPAEIAQTGKTVLDRMWTPDANVKEVLTDMCGALEPLLTAE
jgi:ABC-type glycerol-3-phosphate transport system substrate-binding protein